MTDYIVRVFDQAAEESYEFHFTSEVAFESALEQAGFARANGCKATIIDGDAPVRKWRVSGSRYSRVRHTVFARSSEEALLQVRFDWDDDTFDEVQMVEEGTCAKIRPGVFVYSPTGQTTVVPCEDSDDAHEYLELYTKQGLEAHIVKLAL